MLEIFLNGSLHKQIRHNVTAGCKEIEVKNTGYDVTLE